ncbi:MAG: Sir2 family NAD-dependent protein deacetylase [Rhizobiaceae bacterium]|nr:Sir2 family NAD-dependent protein deacetylase [Rhizobiaceae bacterium]
MVQPDTLDHFKSLVDQASNMVILTGAGISTESGVPDFRSPGGLWEKFRIVQYGEYVESEDARIEDWHRRFYMKDQIGSVEPNIGHRKIGEWLNSGKAQCLITQNVDGLHQRGGAPDDKIIEIHGNATTTSCISCGLNHDMQLCRDLFEKTQESPKCSSCGGLIKADIVMFGESMPTDKTNRAFEIAETADLFIAIGTSLVVQPAAVIPLHAKRNGAKFAILNRDPTELDRFADCVVNAEIGETLGACV